MAKFELTVFDNKTGDVKEVMKCAFIPVNLFIRFQQLAEDLTANKITDDAAMFEKFKPLFLEMFPRMTEDDYLTGVDIADAIFLFNAVNKKAATLVTGNAKN